MPALSRYGAAGAQSKKLSRRLGKASEYGSLARTAKETGARKQQAIKDTLESIQKIADTVGEVRKEVKFGEEVEDIARGAYGIETKTEEGILGIPKTTYTEKDTGEVLSAMDIYAYGKYGEGTAKHEKWFGEESARKRGMKQIAAKQESDIDTAAVSYAGKKEQYDLMQKQNRELLDKYEPSVEIVADDSAYVTRGVKPDVLERGAVVEEAYVEGSQYSKEDLERIKAKQLGDESSLSPKRIEPSIGPGRKEPEKTGSPLKFEASYEDAPGSVMDALTSPDKDYLWPGAAKGKITSSLVERVIGVESSGISSEVNKKSGAQGLMQIMPNTAKEIRARLGEGKWTQLEGEDAWSDVELGVDLLDPKENIRLGTEYLNILSEKYGGNIENTLMAYNWGRGNVDKLLSGQPLRIPDETQQYMDKVLGISGMRETKGEEEKILSRVRTNYGGMY